MIWLKAIFSYPAGGRNAHIGRIGGNKMGILERMRLDGKKIFITGGAQGIGLCLAMGLAEAGADLALVDINLPEAEKAAKLVKEKTGREAFAVHADVTCPQSVDAMIATIQEKFKRIDVAFCNAGIALNVPSEEMTYEQWKNVIDVNLTGVYLTAVAAGKVMLKQGGGSIINTASMSAHVVNIPQKQSAYNTSKAGVIQLTKSLAVEWATRNVRVNSISPGYISTELILENPSLAPLIAQWKGLSPLKRLGTPEELQAIAVYLAGDTSMFTTGSDFVIDGAYSCI